MLARAAQGAKEGEWLRAERQSAGRGRMGRDWLEQSGNLYASTIVRIGKDDPPTTLLAMVAGIAFAHTAMDFAGEENVQLKWPNDVMIGSAKMGGILLERQDDAVIAGFGLNIISAPQIDGRITIALSDVLPRNMSVPSAHDVCEKLAHHFANSLSLWRSDKAGRNPVLDKWCAMAHAKGAELSVTDLHGAPLQGRFAGLEQDGALRLQRDDEIIDVIRAGDVALIGEGEG
jgi:BirA family biotin operon repressor/biotin-[acetyl-CoA-carboxylase] ligase